MAGQNVSLDAFQEDLNARLAEGCELEGNLQVENNAMFADGVDQSPRFFAQGVICPDESIAMGLQMRLSSKPNSAKGYGKLNAA